MFAAVEDWCADDRCGSSSGGLCYMLDGGARFECVCNVGFEPVYTTVNSIQAFERCSGEWKWNFIASHIG